MGTLDNAVYTSDNDHSGICIRWSSTSQGVITAKIVDLDQNPPPNPVADDRNDSYTKPSVPSNAQVTSCSWGVWYSTVYIWMILDI